MSLRAHINDTETILKCSGILDVTNPSPNYWSINVDAIRDLTYLDQFDHIRRNRYFDFALLDGALLQFVDNSTKTTEKLSFSYLDCPVVHDSFAEFAAEFPEDIFGIGEEELRSHYSEQRQVKGLRQAICPIRYDYAPDQYQCGLHPAAHIHFGHDNSIRVACKKLMKPQSFTLFILRQFYPDFWKNFLEHREFGKWSNFIRDSLAASQPFDFSDKDDHELRLE